MATGAGRRLGVPRALRAYYCMYARQPRRHALPSPDFQVDTTRKVPMPHSTTEPVDGYGLGDSALRLPEYGVLNITLKTAYAIENDRNLFNSLHLWPAEYDGSTLTIGSLCFYEHPCDIVSVAVGSAATCSITLDEAHGLGLVQYLPHLEPQIQFQPINIPDLHVRSDWRIALDDRLGIFYTGHSPVDPTTCLQSLVYGKGKSSSSFITVSSLHLQRQL
ncbi:hypothetical protein DFH06DRAFT_1367069 [Mycena polygramma]|nr:hypothetical protein DFH06DRAFT_1367069 [Mycena polygramma]